LLRLNELKIWIEGTYPVCYWLAGFTYPADFLTAVLQTTARKNLIPIDTLVWDFTCIYKDEMEITEYPKEGIYVKGLYLEGAGWDRNNDCLCVCLPVFQSFPLFDPISALFQSSNSEEISVKFRKSLL
jgi:dynein heavy chain